MINKALTLVALGLSVASTMDDASQPAHQSGNATLWSVAYNEAPASLNMTELVFAFHTLSEFGHCVDHNLTAYEVCMYAEVGHMFQHANDSSTYVAHGYQSDEDGSVVTLGSVDHDGNPVTALDHAVNTSLVHYNWTEAANRCASIKDEDIIATLLGDASYEEVFDSVYGAGLPQPAMSLTKRMAMQESYCNSPEQNCLDKHGKPDVDMCYKQYAPGSQAACGCGMVSSNFAACETVHRETGGTYTPVRYWVDNTKYVIFQLQLVFVGPRGYRQRRSIWQNQMIERGG